MIARRGLLLLLVLSFALNLVPLWWGLPGYPTWAPDEIVPFHVLSPERWPEKYPPFHRYLLATVYLPLDWLLAATAAKVDWLQRIALLQAIGRLVSVIMGTAIVYWVYRCGRLLFDRRAALVGAAIVAFSPSFVYYAKTVNLETPYLFWFSLSIFLLLRAARDGTLRDHLLFGLTAALAVGTKDQAYGLYLASPLVLYWGHRERRSADGEAAGVGRFLTDRRLWAAILAGAMTLVAIYRLPFGWSGFMHHFDVVTGDKTMVYQTYARSLMGQGTMLLRAVINFGFGLGLPWLLTLAAGIGLAVRDTERRWVIVGLLALATGYYLGFVTVIGYHYVRFFLPLVILAAPVAAWGLLRSLDKLGWSRATPALVTLTLLFTLARALTVDAAMLDDSRYRAEEFLATTTVEPILGLGRKSALPRGVGVAAWESLTARGCDFLDRDLNGLVVNTTDLRGDRERATYSRLVAGDLGFDPVWQQAGWTGVPGMRLDNADSNLAFVSPGLQVFARTDRPCLDADTLSGVLTSMKASPSPSMRQILIEAIRAERLPLRTVGESPPVPAIHLRFDGWTYGEQPTAALLENPGETLIIPRVEIGCWAQPKDYPIVAILDDGRSRREVRFTRPGQKQIAMDPLAPTESALVLIWSDKGWLGREPNPRVLGVNLTAIRFVAGE